LELEEGMQVIQELHELEEERLDLLGEEDGV